MSDDPTLSPNTPNTPRKALAWLWTWGWAHTVASAAILGALTGYIAGKLF